MNSHVLQTTSINVFLGFTFPDRSIISFRMSQAAKTGFHGQRSTKSLSVLIKVSFSEDIFPLSTFLLLSSIFLPLARYPLTRKRLQSIRVPRAAVRVPPDGHPRAPHNDAFLGRLRWEPEISGHLKSFLSHRAPSIYFSPQFITIFVTISLENKEFKYKFCLLIFFDKRLNYLDKISPPYIFYGVTPFLSLQSLSNFSFQLIFFVGNINIFIPSLL